ncbi:MAG: hypothetical protein MRZ70_02490 [Prevotella sp.]|nr:hypothetical protein [Prevotella sp.]
MEFNLDTTIKDLYDWGQISVRTANSLHHAGIETLGDVLNRIETPMDLLNIRNFGRKSYMEMELILNKMIRRHAEATLQTKEERFAALGENLVKIIAEAYTAVTVGESGVRSYLQAAYPQPSDFHFLVMGDVDNMLAVVEDYSRDENLAIRHSYKQFIAIALAGMENAQQAENDVYAEYKRKSMDLAMRMEDFSYEQVAMYFLSPIAKNYLGKSYQEQVESSLSVRSKNFAAKFLPHFSDLIKYADEPLASYRNICPRQSMKKTLTEIFQFNQKFRREFDRVSKLTDDEIQTEFLKRDYPYLISRQRQFVFDFIKENNHAPLFFLMLQYLRLSENRSNKIYCLYHGIFDGKKRTLNEIADAMGLTRERCRQIVSGTIDAQESEIATNDGWENYQELFGLPFVYERTEEYIRLRESEHLSENFEIFAALLNLKGYFMVENVEGHTILVNKHVEGFSFSDCLDTLFSIVNAKYSVDTYVALDSILYAVPEQLKADMKALIRFVAKDIYKVQITEDGQLYLPQNYIDIAEELYDILAKRGEPTHVEEIFNEFKRRYPDHKYSEPLQIKSSLYRHKHIRAIGKTSCYALDSWEGVYFGSIRDLLVDLLSESDVPQHIDILYERVSEYYPNTTKASVAATMEDENLQRFLEFEGKYFGLTSKQYPAEYVVATTVQRYSFEERFQMFKNFVDTYHRFPSYNGSEEEASLMRWFHNATNDVLTISEEQKALLDATTKRYDDLGYPRSATESEFLLKCMDVKDYICQHHTLPTNREAPELYAWLRRSRDNYDSFTDKRRLYMTELLNYILSFGFSI